MHTNFIVAYNEIVKTKQLNSLPYIGASLALIVVAIVFSAFLNQRQSSGTPADIRARATAPGMVKVTGIVSEIDENQGTLVVDNLAFEDSTKNLGSWTVTPPLSFSLSNAYPGVKLLITVDPPTMLAQSKTFTALEIKISDR